MHEKFPILQIINMKIFNKYACATATIRVTQLLILTISDCNICLSVNKHIKFISTDSITRNFSCTDVNNNLQLSYSSWVKCRITLLTNMKGLGCTATECLSDKRLS